MSKAIHRIMHHGKLQNWTPLWCNFLLTDTYYPITIILTFHKISFFSELYKKNSSLFSVFCLAWISRTAGNPDFTCFTMIEVMVHSVQDCGNSTTNPLELSQFCTQLPKNSWYCHKTSVLSTIHVSQYSPYLMYLAMLTHTASIIHEMVIPPLKPYQSHCSPEPPSRLSCTGTNPWINMFDRYHICQTNKTWMASLKCS